MALAVPAAQPGQTPRPANTPAGPAQPETAPPRARSLWRPLLGALVFAIMVGGPTALAAWYLQTMAADRYVSRAAFSVRSHDAAQPMEVFGAIAQFAPGPGLADGQIVYDFIQSQQIVERIGRTLDLDAMWNRAPGDILFALGRDRPVEDVHDHWLRMTDVTLDPATGILTLEVRAFTAGDARAIAKAVLAVSGQLVNDLSEDARADAVRFAERERDQAEARLRAIRAKLRAFRDLEQEVDPTQNARAALGLVAALEEDRAKLKVRVDQLASALDPNAPRLTALQRRLAILDARITAERTRLGSGTDAARDADRPLADVVGDYEELLVDREFAEQAYKLALATYEQAQAEARRRHRYLAVHIQPTLSEEAQLPDRPVWIGTVFGGALAIWAIVMLMLANVRERR